MKLKRIIIKQFRCYLDEVIIDFEDITTFIGKNDIGKSTVMEALEIFFNNDIVKIGPDDLNIKAPDKFVTISCEFTDLPNELVLDSDAKTNLESEYLLTEDKTLLIQKVYDCSKAKVSQETFIIANHPSKEPYSSILTLKQKELQRIIEEKHLEANKTINSEMRKAIWKSVTEEELQLNKTIINISKAKDDTKEIWSKLEQYLPTFALFQSDRSSTDNDSEVQNPMKHAIQLAISEAQAEIDAINAKVQQRAMEIANNTHAVLQTLDKNLASSISPKFDKPASSKWNNLFSISMNTEEDIPLNKRGSGIRRMILVSFFKAEADRKSKIGVENEKRNRDVIYAIEEPETSLHPNYQEIIIRSFYELSTSNHCQVVLTTHSPNLAKELPINSLRFITRDEQGKPIIKEGDVIIPEIVETLGVLPNIDPHVQVILCVEGPTDVIAMYGINRCLREKYQEIVDLKTDKRIAVIPLGGSILKHWVDENYLKRLNCKEVHIYDNDVNTYQQSVDEINRREDGSWATLTKKYEIENYLHPDAIKEGYGFSIDTSIKGVPAAFGVEYAAKMNWPKCKDNTSKIKLSSIFEQKMNIARLEEIDPEGETKNWFTRITGMLN